MESFSTRATYRLGTAVVDRPLLAKPGLTVSFDCKSGYMNDLQKQKDFECNDNGEWNGEKYECIADCGRVISYAEALINNGNTASAYEIPWNAGIYRNNKHICGAAIISGECQWFYFLLL